MDAQNLAYALIQLAHNFGAVAVVGVPLLALWPQRPELPVRRKMAWLVLAGWAVQGMSGAGFGIISYTYYGTLPDIYGIAVAALLIKMACAVAGFVLVALLLRYGAGWAEGARDRAWGGLLVLGVTALTAAAFLRWFS